MLYINENDIQSLDLSWEEYIDSVEGAVECLDFKDFAQPVKPYLRYKKPVNRIIAMPAYLGGDFDMAGIKWIASFPENIEKGIPRAHSVVILNHSETGQPVAMINTPLLSVIRTASVSGLMIRHYLKARPGRPIRLGITGWGPIGKMHYEMCRQVLGDLLEEVCIFDIREIDSASVPAGEAPVKVVKSWQDCYEKADIFITCTVSKNPYIDAAPKESSLHLNVSLRDYQAAVFPYFQGAIGVDDWDEVCRENTDIEQFHRQKGLQKEDTFNIADIVRRQVFTGLEGSRPILFNPMGMAIFDIAVGTVVYRQMQSQEKGLVLS